MQVEGIVLQRFGRECCRIYRLLAIKGQLEQKQVRFTRQFSLVTTNNWITLSMSLSGLCYLLFLPDWRKSDGSKKCERVALSSS